MQSEHVSIRLIGRTVASVQNECDQAEW